MKKLLRVAVYFFTATILLYLIIALSYGGFGKQSFVKLAKPEGDSLLLFAHRGVLNYYPEHSRQGAEVARHLGFNGIEIDIRRTADDVLIVFHDETAERMLGINKPVESLTLAELKRQPLLFQHERTTNYIFTVDEFLSAYKDRFVIYFDMKITRFKDVDNLVELINKHSTLANTCILASADFFVIEYISIYHGETITALEGFDSGKEWLYNFIPKNLRPDYYSGFFQKIDSAHVNWLKKKGLLHSRIVYGVDKSNYSAAKNQGIINIIVDYDSSFGDVRKDINPSASH